MRKFQVLLISAAILLLAGLYTFGRRVPNAKELTNHPPAGAAMNTQNVQAADLSVLLSDAKKSLPPATQVQLAELEHAVVRGAVKEDQMHAYHALARVWDSLQHIPLAAHYMGEAAKLENSEKSLTFAANLFLAQVQQTEDPAVRKWEANEAHSLLTQALELDPENDTIKAALGNAYIAGGQVMQGVQQLLAVTESDPDNLDANLTLGRLAITSGQYDKAVKRLEGVAARHPDNTEALYFLAEAYKALGNKEKAIALFERCKQLVNNPEFSQQIDDYINSFK